MRGIEFWKNVALPLIDKTLPSQPDMTLAEFRSVIVTAIETMRVLDEKFTSPCVHCGRPAVYLGDEEGVRHLGPNGEVVNKGCRAASFEYAGTWDNTLDRKWNATQTERKD
jgi:hypothetical protein